MFVRRFVLCVLAGALLVSCQPEPNKQHADRNAFYQDVKTAKVVVRETYGAQKGISLPFKNYVAAWLRIAGVAVADNDAASGDCIIRILAEGEPLKAKYGSSGSLFTGARLSGKIQIERPSIHKDEVAFSGVINPPRTFSGSDKADYGRPENAPFLHVVHEGDSSHKSDMEKAAFDAFTSRLARLMGLYFGKSVLLIALDETMLRESAIEALAALGMPSVPYLIDAFRYCSPEGEKGLGEALAKITGEKYGSDVKRWNEWLRNRQ